MRYLTFRTFIRELIKTWTSARSTRRICNQHASLREKLSALDLATCTQEEVSAIISNDRISMFICDECKQPVQEAVQYGNVGRFTLCLGCLCSGVDLILVKSVAREAIDA